VGSNIFLIRQVYVLKIFQLMLIVLAPVRPISIFVLVNIIFIVKKFKASN